MGKKHYNIDCIKFTEKRYEMFPDMEESVQFDPKVHLDLQLPKFINDLNFNQLEFPTDQHFDIAYSAPHKVFS